MGHIGAMPEPVIQVESLVKRYGDTVAVDGIGFAVERGVTAALLGRQRRRQDDDLVDPAGSAAADLRRGRTCSARTCCGTATACCRG